MTEYQERNLRLMADPASYVGNMTRAECSTVAAAVEEIDRLRAELGRFIPIRSTPDRPDPFLSTLETDVRESAVGSVSPLAEAMNLAAGLCHSEANRWKEVSPGTAEHWRSIAVRLQAGYLSGGQS